jgi:phenylacetate-coenzyme A ligase PaaK-like adenylate-forming protein
MIFGSERASDAMRERIQTLLGVEHMFDIPGMTELYGPGTGLDCSYHTGFITGPITIFWKSWIPIPWNRLRKGKSVRWW